MARRWRHLDAADGPALHTRAHRSRAHKTRGAIVRRALRPLPLRSFIQARGFAIQTPPAFENHSGCGGS